MRIFKIGDDLIVTDLSSSQILDVIDNLKTSNNIIKTLDAYYPNYVTRFLLSDRVKEIEL